MAAGRASGARRLDLPVLHLRACVQVRVHAPAWLWRACVRRKDWAAPRVQASCLPLLALSFIPQCEPQCRERCGHCAGRRARVLAGCSHMYMHRHDEHRCIFTYTHTHTHTHVYTRTHTRTHIHIHKSPSGLIVKDSYMHTHTHTHTHTHKHTCSVADWERADARGARGGKNAGACAQHG
jgi:hypothetical protein